MQEEDKPPSSSPSQPRLLNKHCRLDSLELQSLHPESPIDPPDVLYRPGKKLRAEGKDRDGEMEEGEKKEPVRQAEYMALLIRSKQQFTCLFKFILVCKAAVTAPGERSPLLVAKGNLLPSKRNKVCIGWNQSHMMERFFCLCETTSHIHWKDNEG